MKKNMYIIPATETIEIRTCGVLMVSDGKGDPNPDKSEFSAPRRKVF